MDSNRVYQEDGEDGEENEGWGTGDFTDMLWGSTDDFTEMLPLSLRSHFNPIPVKLMIQKGISQFPERDNLPGEIVFYCFSFLSLSDVCGGVFCTCRHLAHMLMQSGSSYDGGGIVGVGSYLINEFPPLLSTSSSSSSSSSLSSSPSSSMTLATLRLSDTIRDAISNLMPIYDLDDTAVPQSQIGAGGPTSLNNATDEGTYENKLRHKVKYLIKKAVPCLNGPPDVALIFGNSKWHTCLPSIECELKQCLPSYMVTLQCATSRIRLPPSNWHVLTRQFLNNPSHVMEISSRLSPTLSILKQGETWNEDGDALMLIFLRIPKSPSSEVQGGESVNESRASELVSAVANTAKMCCVASGPSQCGIDYASLIDIATHDPSRTPPW